MSRPRRLEPRPPRIFHWYQQTPGTSSNGASVLAAEDDQALHDALARSLSASGAVIDHAATGSKAGTTLITHSEFDLLILDLRSATTHSLEILKRLHARGSHLPVLVLTGVDSLEERVKSLDNGADDCMAKPFSLEELDARVRALSRRGMGISANAIKHGPLVYDQASRLTTFDGKVVKLSARELSLLDTTLHSID